MTGWTCGWPQSMRRSSKVCLSFLYLTLKVCVSFFYLTLTLGYAHAYACEAEGHGRRAGCVVGLSRCAFCMASLNASVRSLCRRPLDRAAPPPWLALILV